MQSPHINGHPFIATTLEHAFCVPALFFMYRLNIIRGKSITMDHKNVHQMFNINTQNYLTMK